MLIVVPPTCIPCRRGTCLTYFTAYAIITFPHRPRCRRNIVCFFTLSTWLKLVWHSVVFDPGHHPAFNFVPTVEFSLHTRDYITNRLRRRPSSGHSPTWPLALIVVFPTRLRISLELPSTSYCCHTIQRSIRLQAVLHRIEHLLFIRSLPSSRHRPPPVT